MNTQTASYRFTVEEFHRMGEAGIFKEDDRVELLEGEVIAMTPIGSRHASCVTRLSRLFHVALGNRALVWVQNPIQLDPRSEPQPDLVLLRPREDVYAGAHPRPEDVLLLIEVSDTTLTFDRDRKLPLYALAKIPEVWIVDLGGACIEVYLDSDGRVYRSVQRRAASEHLVLTAFPDLAVAVNDILPPLAI